ncbi:MAG: ATP-binding cassette domain-containing protein [Sphingobacteriales bacterium]|nr:MAG: ATP-binding cassette domain-containing protein [Sphingobacteriales bacterium]
MSQDIIYTMKGVSKVYPPNRFVLKNIYLSYFYGAKIGVLGLNGSGKSSLLKSLGLAVYLAHLGFPVPAEAMSTTIFNGLITTINLPDDINNGLSHYYSEVKRVKEVSEKLVEKDKILVIFDELFRGTNVKDAYDASLLIISELTAVTKAAFFISTHIVELADELKKYKNISFHCLETFFKDGIPVFTHKLTEGVSKERLGMFIVLNEGIVEVIRNAAGKITNDLYQTPK